MINQADSNDRADSKHHALCCCDMTWPNKRDVAYQKWHQEENEARSVKCYTWWSINITAVPEIRQQKHFFPVDSSCTRLSEKLAPMPFHAAQFMLQPKWGPWCMVYTALRSVLFVQHKMSKRCIAKVKKKRRNIVLSRLCSSVYISIDESF